MNKAIYPGWWQVAVALLIQAVGAASIYTVYSVVVASFKLEFGPSNMVLMLGITVVSLASGLLSPVLGTLIDRFSIRWLMFGSAILLSFGFLLLSFTTSMVQVIAIYALCMSVAAVLMGPVAASALLARWFRRRRGMAIALAASGAAFGGLIFPPLLQALIDSYEWRFALRVFSAIIFLLTAPTIALLVVDRPTEPTLAMENKPGTGTANEPQSRGHELFPANPLRHPTFWLIALVVGTIFCGPVALVSNLIQLVTEKGIDASQGALLLSVFSGAGIAGKLLAASLLDRVDLRLALAAILTVQGIGVFGFLQADAYIALVTAALVTGIAGGSASPVWSVVIARVYGPENVGKTMGLMSFVMMPFTLLSPPVFGRVFDQTGSYDGALIGYIGMLLFALTVCTRLRV